MRRIVGLLGVLCLLLAPVGAVAQTTFPVPGPGAIIYEERASVSVTNSATATALFTTTLPAAYAKQSLHLKLLGYITTNTGQDCADAECTGWTLLTTNYGGTNASATLLNTGSVNGDYVNAPLEINVHYRPSAVTDTASTSVGLPRQYLSGSFEVASSTGVVERFGGQVAGVNLTNQGRTFAVNWQWASASATNSITITNAILTIGN